MRYKKFLYPAGILFIGLVVGLSFGIIFYKISPGSCGDVDGFGALGVRYAKHFDFNGSIRRAPIYPFILGNIYFLFGIYNHYAVIAVQSLFLALLGVSVYCISNSLFKSEKISLLSAVCSILNPIAWWYVPRLWIELPFSIFVLWTTYAATRVLQKPSTKRMVLFGFLCAISSLCKAIMLLFPLFMAVFILLLNMFFNINNRKIFTVKTFVKFLFIPSFVMLVIIFPWTLRNKVVSGKWLLVSSNIGVEFFRGNVFAEENSFLLRKTIVEIWDIAQRKEKAVIRQHGYSEGLRPGDTELDSIFNPLIMDYIVNTPHLFALKIIKLFPCFWIRGENFKKSIIFVVCALFAFFIFVGGFIKYRKKIEIYAFIICILYFNLLYASVLAWARYSTPMYPLMIVWGVPFVVNFVRK